ncbi:MAG: hypothetical protein QXS21_00910 [Thermoproteota archaeon]|nr:hypothetical protein [Candidatus Brockarchaeota archaeon]
MDEIYNFDVAIGRYRRVIAGLKHGALALSFLDHIASFSLSKASLAKYAGHLITILRAMDFDPAAATRKAVERIVTWINSTQNKQPSENESLSVAQNCVWAEKASKACPKFFVH